MTRDETLGLIAAALAAMVSTIMCATCVVVMHAGEARAEQSEVLDASEQPFEPPSEPVPVDIQDASASEWTEPEPEPAWEEPAYVELTYVAPEVTYVAPETTYVAPEPTYYEADYYEPPAAVDSSTDLRTMGVVYDGGTRYTWYSQAVLPGGGLTELNSNGRTLDGAGHVVDGDGYIAVASSDHEVGTVLDTPWGAAKVYDCGCDSGTVDIYTQW